MSTKSDKLLARKLPNTKPRQPTSSNRSRTGGVLLGTESDKLSMTMTRKKSITQRLAGWKVRFPDCPGYLSGLLIPKNGISRPGKYYNGENNQSQLWGECRKTLRQTKLCNIFLVCGNTMCVSTCQVEFVLGELSFFILLPLRVDLSGVQETS